MIREKPEEFLKIKREEKEYINRDF